MFCNFQYLLANPGFDLRGGGRALSQRGGCTSLKVLKIKVSKRNVLACFGHISIYTRLKTNLEQRD